MPLRVSPCATVNLICFGRDGCLQSVRSYPCPVQDARTQMCSSYSNPEGSLKQSPQASVLGSRGRLLLCVRVASYDGNWLRPRVTRPIQQHQRRSRSLLSPEAPPSSIHSL